LRIGKEVFEDYGKKHLKELLEQGERPMMVAGFTSYFDDDKLVSCSKCSTPAYVRPWFLEAIKQYGLRILCVCCVDPQTFIGQVIMDFAKIEEAAKKT